MKHVLGFSGGADSEAVYCWLIDRFPVEDIILLHSNAGNNENPINDRFVENFSATVHPVIMVNAQIGDMWATPGMSERKGYDPLATLDFVTMAEIKKRFPARKAQFCSEILKLAPQKKWMLVNIPDGDYERYTGVRRDESGNRKDTPFREWDNYFDCYVNHPIADWTKDQCFETIKAHGLPINILYLMGFGRVGCRLCINSSKEDIRLVADKFPEIIDDIELWEKRVGKTYFPPIVPGRYMNFIREVVEWSKTDYGGRQYNLFRATAERPTCQSKYGLCE